MKDKEVFFALIFVSLLCSIISTDSDAENHYKIFYAISPLIVIFSFIVLCVTVKKISRYLLIGLIISNLLVQIILNLIYSSALKFTAPKMSFYFLIILTFVFLYRKNRNPVQKEKNDIS